VRRDKNVVETGCELDGEAVKEIDEGPSSGEDHIEVGVG
jgi:hypothetical protein